MDERTKSNSVSSALPRPVVSLLPPPWPVPWLSQPQRPPVDAPPPGPTPGLLGQQAGQPPLAWQPPRPPLLVDGAPRTLTPLDDGQPSGDTAKQVRTPPSTPNPCTRHSDRRASRASGGFPTFQRQQTRSLCRLTTVPAWQATPTQPHPLLLPKSPPPPPKVPTHAIGFEQAASIPSSHRTAGNKEWQTKLV